jgi:hypothetical protein
MMPADLMSRACTSDRSLRLDALLALVDALRFVREPGGESHRDRRAHRIHGDQSGVAVRIEFARPLRRTLKNPGCRGRGIDVHFTSATRAFVRFHEGSCIGQRARAQIAGNDLIEETQTARLGGIDRTCREDQLERLFGADEPRHALRAAGPRNDAERHFRHPKASRGCRDTVVAREGYLHTPAHDRAMHGGDDRKGQRFDSVEERAIFDLTRRPAEFADIGAREEGTALAHQHDRLDVAPCADLLNHAAQIGAHACVNCVDGWVVHSDQRGCTFDFHPRAAHLGHRPAPFIQGTCSA